jgi:ankyrin repeat protein
VVPGNSANSFLLYRVTGTEFGMQMPPTGPLKPEQIDTIRKWIEQGAVWPDALANEADLPPLNPKAIAMVDALRRNDMAEFRKSAGAEPALLNARGPEGSTPFMYAVLYAPSSMLAELLKAGADPNRHNDAGATALMWAVTDIEKTRILLDRGADVNARSDDMRTPLLIAAGRPGGSAVVKLLLDHGAKTDPNSKPAGESSALIEAATAGDFATMQLLAAHGADVKAAGQPAMSMAILNRCAKCLDLLLAAKPGKEAATGSLWDTAAFADAVSVRRLIDAGADVKAADPTGRTPLEYAAGSDLIPLDVVKLLVEHGADVNGKVAHAKSSDTGRTVLDIARLRGNTPVVDFLVKAGAKGSAPAAPAPAAKQGNTIQTALQAVLPRLQRTDAAFTTGAGCVSCHNDSLTAMTLGQARKRGFSVDEAIAKKQVETNSFYLEKMRDRLHEGFFVPVEDYFGPGIIGYMLMGFDAEHVQPNLDTDTAARYIKMHQSPNGEWRYSVADQRPPLCSEYIGETATAMRGLQLYAPAAEKAAYQKSVDLAAAWLATAQPKVSEDRSWRLMGLAWAGKNPGAVKAAVKDLLAFQRADGGWPDIPTMESSAYSTGMALVALRTAGMAVSDPAYQKGVKYLLSTQQNDGTWYVKSRALSFQPFFDAGYSHGFDQFISAAGSNWAAMALASAIPEAKGSGAGPSGR